MPKLNYNAVYNAEQPEDIKFKTVYISKHTANKTDAIMSCGKCNATLANLTLWTAYTTARLLSRNTSFLVDNITGGAFTKKALSKYLLTAKTTQKAAAKSLSRLRLNEQKRNIYIVPVIGTYRANVMTNKLGKVGREYT